MLSLRVARFFFLFRIEWNKSSQVTEHKEQQK